MFIVTLTKYLRAMVTALVIKLFSNLICIRTYGNFSVEPVFDRKLGFGEMNFLLSLENFNFSFKNRTPPELKLF